MTTKSLTLNKINALQGSVSLVGSKSLTNRVLLLSALGKGTCRISNILRSDDSEVMLLALQKLGVQISFDQQDPTSLQITGLARPFALEQSSLLELFLGNAGTAMRPLCAALALSSGSFKLTGEPRMYERPIGVLVDALRQIGSKIEYLGTNNYPPLLIEGLGAKLNKIEQPVVLQVSGNTSSQFISALLMVGALLPHGLELQVTGELISKPYVKMTCDLLKNFGVSVQNFNYQSFKVEHQPIINPESFLVEGDASGATYFLAGAAISGEITVYGIGKNSVQGDALFADLLAIMGAHVEKGDNYIKVQSPQTRLKGICVDMNDMPDAAMTLVPMALFTKDPIKITNIASWRVKETDRIAAMACEMRKLGCHVVEGDDFIEVDGNTLACQNFKEQGLVPSFDTYNDHRMAMCMSLVALDRNIIINDPDCCKKTFPDYFERLAKVTV